MNEQEDDEEEEDEYPLNVYQQLAGLRLDNRVDASKSKPNATNPKPNTPNPKPNGS